ncbi:MAG: TlyA family RNA methyltransferase [Nitrospirae bacterium]|nr:TlyA family RNA methyltransferase [Nitrospirota bacterium]
MVPPVLRALPPRRSLAVVRTPKSSKERLDVLLARRGLAVSREQAQRLILAGRVAVPGLPHPKAGSLVAADSDIRVGSDPLPFASRGGVKLRHALDVFGLDPTGCVCADIGSSAGGFTDCLLKAGAARVHAVDVGKGLLDPRLRADPRVKLIEDTNARYLGCEQVPEPLDLVTVDVSFISATHILRAVTPLLRPGGMLVVLVKPQFELTPKDNRKGVVRDPAKQAEAVAKIRAFGTELGLQVSAETESPLRGPKGNREFFVLLTRQSAVESRQ